MNDYDANGKKIGHSSPSFFGGMNHYDNNGHKVGESRPGFFGGFGYYRDLPDWYDPRLSIWHFLLRRRFRHWNEYADRCAGNQYRIRYQAARGKELGIL